MTARLDTAVLESRLSEVAIALFGRGSDDGEVQLALKAETGQLAGRIGDVIGPRTKSKASNQAEKAIRKVNVLPDGADLMNMPGVEFADWTWLYASPKALVGVKNEDYQVALDGQSAMDFFRSEQHKGKRKPVYRQIGKRGKQVIMQYNKGIISESAAAFIKASILGKMGELGAAFYNVAVRYVPRKKVPSFMASKMPQAESDGKSKVSESGMGTSDPSIEFTVNGKGLESNPALDAKIQFAINGTVKSMEQKLKKLARGAKYVFETGQVYFEKEEESL